MRTVERLVIQRPIMLSWAKTYTCESSTLSMTKLLNYERATGRGLSSLGFGSI